MQIHAQDLKLGEDAIRALESDLNAAIAGRMPLLNNRNGQQSFITEVEGHPAIVKRYIGACAWPASLRPFPLSRPCRAYRQARKLARCNIAVPRPLLLLTHGRDAFTVTERLEATELYQKMRIPDWLCVHEDMIAIKLRQLMHTMAKNRVTHGDLHARNILIDEAGCAWLIDLDGIRFHRTGYFYHRRRAKEEHRLGASLDHAATELRRKSGFTLQEGRWRWQAPPPLAF
jgi:hypothetical protein